MDNPCLSCGACCAYFRVSFYWSEAEVALGGRVPPEMTVPIHTHLIAMKGSDAIPPRCCALQGEIGQAVYCSIYEQRPAVCSEIMYTGFGGLSEEKCDKARMAHGLPPLSPDFAPANDTHPELPQSA